MDANGLRSFSLSLTRGLEPWPLARGTTADGTALPPAITVERNDAHLLPSVRLANAAAPQPLKEKAQSADQVVLAPSLAIDALGSYVVWDDASGTLFSVSFLAGQHPLAPVPIALPAEAMPVHDLAFGADDVLYVAGGDGVLLIDMRARFAPTFVSASADAPDFRVHRLTAHQDQGVYALDVEHGLLGRIHGLPPFDRGVDVRRERNDRFEATDPNPQPLRLQILAGRIDAGERAVALAVADDGILAVLSVQRAQARASLRFLRSDATLSARVELEGPELGGIGRPHTLAWLDNEQVALLTDAVALAPDGAPLPNRDLGAFVYRMSAALKEALLQGGPQDGIALLHALGDFYPLPGRLPGVHPGPFANTVPGRRPRVFFARPGPAGLPEPAPLARISLAARTGYGAVANFDDERVRGAYAGAAVGVIDSGDPTTVWHRLYVEGAVPAGTAMIVWLAANDERPPSFDFGVGPGSEVETGFGVETGATAVSAHRNAGIWFPHIVGDPHALPPAVARELPATAPRAAWVQDASEVAQGRSVLQCGRVPNVSGLFTALIQRADLRVRALSGRRLWVLVELFGNGRATPELAVVRCYAGRVSYRDRHLPAMYREQVFGAQAGAAAAATGADFLERFIDLFEGVFTSIEERIAYAHLLTDVWSCPPEALAWLGSWIGMALEPGMPSAQARLMLANGSRLARSHGTLEGLRLALDIATAGAVARGRIVVLENFRLRRTLATILGAQLADYDDPLTAGIAQSGNSFVGDSLFLGDENVNTFLALFRTLSVDPSVAGAAAAQLSSQREQAKRDLYDGLAHRATVLVHEAADDDELRLVTRIAADAAPAHVLLRVVRARYPFLVAVASLIGADTYLRKPQPVMPVRIGDSQLGYADTLQGLGTLDARGGAFGSLAGPAEPPVADAIANEGRLSEPLALAGPAEPPVADAGEDREVPFGDSFTLDGSRSHAAPGRRITQFNWTLLPRSN